jgi:hypothetical protein
MAIATRSAVTRLLISIDGRATVAPVQQNNILAPVVVNKTTFWLARAGRVWIIAVVHP